MKKLIAITLICISINAFADGLTDIKKATLEGYKAIRHDALVRLKFRKAHEMKIEIKKLEAEIKKG